jgi:DNA-binding GntR family transcriptional regulator
MRNSPQTESIISKTDLAYDIIRNKIIMNILKPHSPINQGDICTELGISRTPVRGALQKLTYDGLLEYIPEKGMFVTQFKFTDILEIAEVRIPNECLAIRLATVRMSDDDLDELEDCLQLKDISDSQSILEEAFKMDSLFHELIAKGSKNSILASTCIDLIGLSARGTYITKTDPSRIQHATKMHADIVKAMKNRDAVSASNLLEKHLTDWVAYMNKQLAENFYMFK